MISFVSLIATAVTQCRQNAQWNALNLATLSITQLRFYGWRELSSHEFHSLSWGYEPEARSSADDFVFRPDKLIVENEIVAYDRDKRQLIEGTQAVTVPELEEELKARSVASQLQFLKHYRLLTQVDNTGATTAIIKWIRLYSEDRNDLLDKEPIFSPNQPGSAVNPKRFVVVSEDIYIPLSEKLPSPWVVHLDVAFSDVHGQSHAMPLGTRLESLPR